MGRAWATAALVVAVVGLTGGIAAARPLRTGHAGGRIEGRVVISQALVQRRPRFRIYASAGPGSQPPQGQRPDSIGELLNVVLYLDDASIASATSATSARDTLAQRDEQFVPHVLPIVRGTTVVFPNYDDIYHNVFSLSKTREFNLGKYPKGEFPSRVFGKTGTVKVFCEIHADMSATILVLPNTFFAKPTEGGRFAIDGIPPGEYTIVAWHERISPVRRRVRVTEGGILQVDFNIPLPPAPGGR